MRWMLSHPASRAEGWGGFLSFETGLVITEAWLLNCEVRAFILFSVPIHTKVLIEKITSERLWK